MVKDTTKRRYPQSQIPSYGGWNTLLGCNRQALALFRITLGGLLLAELLLRFRFLHPYYTDEGTLPIKILLPQIDPLYRFICIHAYSGSLIYQQILLTLQCTLALCLTLGYRTKPAACASWFLYLSLTLRNTWLNFILDRYFHHLLFYAMFLPMEYCSVDDNRNRQTNKGRPTTDGGEEDGEDTDVDGTSVVVSIATVALKAQVLWIYLDAGYGKYSDPLQGWTFGADPLPALDTYARHTIVARYMYSLLGPFGLRLLTPTVVWVELLCAPVALLGSYLGRREVTIGSVATICSLHFGIALTVRNTYLLGAVACSAWTVYLPPLGMCGSGGGGGGAEVNRSPRGRERIWKGGAVSRLGTFLIVLMISSSIWFETLSEECNQSMKHIWSTLLHNRWNVFIGAEEYVTWEIAPGRLADGTIVDVWARKDGVEWDMPGTGASCTSTARPGRWRSFPYLAGLEGEEGEVLWSYLCKQWDRENGVVGVDGNLGRKLLRFNFFMLQADVLPNMGFSATRKRLIHSHDCTKIESVVEVVEHDREEL